MSAAGSHRRADSRRLGEGRRVARTSSDRRRTCTPAHAASAQHQRKAACMQVANPSDAVCPKLRCSRCSCCCCSRLLTATRATCKRRCTARCAPGAPTQRPRKTKTTLAVQQMWPLTAALAQERCCCEVTRHSPPSRLFVGHQLSDIAAFVASASSSDLNRLPVPRPFSSHPPPNKNSPLAASLATRT
jgi:hypothetical protein